MSKKLISKNYVEEFVCDACGASIRTEGSVTPDPEGWIQIHFSDPMVIWTDIAGCGNAKGLSELYVPDDNPESQKKPMPNMMKSLSEYRTLCACSIHCLEGAMKNLGTLIRTAIEKKGYQR